jgi:chitinase
MGVIASGFGYSGVTTPPFSNYTGAAFESELVTHDVLNNFVNKNGYVRHWDKNAESPWLYNKEKQIMITYDDAESYKTKAEWAVDKGIGGIFMWELKQDAQDHLVWNSVNQVLAKKGVI